MFYVIHWFPTAQKAPAKYDAHDHTQSNLQRPTIVGIAALAFTHARMKGNWTLNDGQPQLHRDIEQMGIELEVDSRIDRAEQARDRPTPDKLIGGTYVGDRGESQVLLFKQLAYIKIP